MNNSLTMRGLNSKEAEEGLKKYGLNEIPERKVGFLLKAVRWLISPIALMLLGAALLSLWGGKTFDFYFIIFLMILNFVVGFWQENKADNAIKKLKESLSMEINVLRDGKWVWLNSKLIVPGDVINLMVGDIIPADGKLIESQNLTINEAVLTGESLPKEKNADDTAYSGSFVATGGGILMVESTGTKTYFGKTITLVEKTTRKSLLEKDILRISKFLMVLSLIGVVIITALFLVQHVAWSDILILDLSLIIAGIPVSLPTVMTLIISLGALELAKKKTIVRRLSALEDLANVNMLLTDKTGTLTENMITVVNIISYGAYSENDVIHYAAAASPENTRSSIDKAINKKADDLKIIRDFSVIKSIPADSERKRGTALISFGDSKILVSVGAPQVIENISKIGPDLKAEYEKDIEKAANDGYRVISVSISKTSEEEKDMDIVGIMLLSDPLDRDAREVIDFLRINGIGVKMLTGDNIAITKRTSAELALLGKVTQRDEVNWNSNDKNYFDGIGAFAQILPEDKFKLAKLAESNGYIVAMTGDGVNDLPAIKEANVGIAVKNAVDALKSAADIVLLSPGITVIKDALIEARKIFARLYSYSIYRISESFRLIITVVVLGLIYKAYPLSPVQLLVIAILNDIPIISMAFDKVKYFSSPSKIKVAERFTLSSLYGLAGILNSLILFFLMADVFHMNWDIIQTIYFLKITVSGHMLIYVAHTKERWYKFLPSRPVILSTSITQIAASLMAYLGILMTSIPLSYIIGVWIWCFLWMQFTELTKIFDQKLIAPRFER